MMFSRQLLVVLSSFVAAVTAEQLMSNNSCPPPRKFKMACYKCGQEMDCVIDDANMLLHQPYGLELWEKQEIVRVLKTPGTFCTNDRTDTAKQQNCAGAKFAFKTDHCHIPHPVIGESNKCPIRGKYGLSNWAEYEIELSTHGHVDYGKMCCHGMSNYHLVHGSRPVKCDTNDSCQGKCTICDDGYTSGELVAAGKLVQDHGQCAHADMPALTVKATCQWDYQPVGYVVTPPSSPTEPATPSDPADPADPAEPSDPSEPADPSDPAAPSDPADPADPSDPAAPSDPAEPAAPDDGSPSPPDDGSPAPPDEGSPAPPDDGEPSLSSLSSPVECSETTYILGTSDEVCPNAVEPVIKIERDNDGGLGFNPIDFIYGLEFDTAAKTVTFKVENPLAGDADLFVSYMKPAAILDDEPDCVSSIDQPRCFPDAQPITAYCNEMDGKEALVHLYIASSDTFLQDVGQVATVKECCYPPENKYDDTYSIIEYAVTIKCDCPETSVVRKLLRGHW